MKRPTPFIKLMTLLALLAFGMTACMAKKPAFHNEAIDPPVAAAEISMTAHNGQPFNLNNERGKVVLVAFGFTNCPDECPLTMAHIKQALELLGEPAKNVQVVLVSTDPVRDTPQALGDYLGAFNPAFLGIPGSPDKLSKIYAAYGVVVEDGGETHSAQTFVVDKSGNLRLTFLPEAEPAEVAADLKILLEE